MSEELSRTLMSLETRHRDIKQDLLGRLDAAAAQGRETQTPTEERMGRELVELDRRIADTRAELSRCGDFSHLSRAIERNQTDQKRHAVIPDSHLCYRRSDQKTSWLRDLALVKVGMDHGGDCQRRLQQHGYEVATDPAFAELRAINRTDGTGGYAVPPAWLVNQYVELARPGRAFANLVQRQPLPGGTDSINIPKLLTGTAVGVQTSDNTVVTDVDLTDTYINAPVQTISGQQGVAIQLIDQSPIAFDDVVFRDLVAAHAAVTDQQVIAGSGTSGQVLGVLNTPGIHTIAVDSVTIQGIYTAIANAIQLIHTTRFLPPEVIVMHPRRWGWLLSLLDTQNRPLFLPYTNMPFNTAGILTDVASQQVVGSVAGLPVVTDPNITTTAGSETPTGTEDVIFVMRASDCVVFESGIRARVLPETQATTLTVLLQIYSYIASLGAQRYPQSVCVISGLTPPVW